MLACKMTAEIVQLRDSRGYVMRRVAATRARPGPERAACKLGPLVPVSGVCGQPGLSGPPKSGPQAGGKGAAGPQAHGQRQPGLNVRLCVAVGVSLPCGDWGSSRAEVPELRLPDGLGFGR